LKNSRDLEFLTGELNEENRKRHQGEKAKTLEK
jgi:hypothetical protein